MKRRKRTSDAQIAANRGTARVPHLRVSPSRPDVWYCNLGNSYAAGTTAARAFFAFLVQRQRVQLKSLLMTTGEQLKRERLLFDTNMSVVEWPAGCTRELIHACFKKNTAHSA